MQNEAMLSTHELEAIESYKRLTPKEQAQILLVIGSLERQRISKSVPSSDEMLAEFNTLPNTRMRSIAMALYGVQLHSGLMQYISSGSAS